MNLFYVYCSVFIIQSHSRGFIQQRGVEILELIPGSAGHEAGNEWGDGMECQSVVGQ